MNRPLRFLMALGLAIAALSWAHDASAQSPADAKRTLKIGKEFYKEPGLMEVKIQSMRGMIMLTGSVATEDMSKKAEAIAKDQKGIKEVRNRIVVRPPDVATPTDAEILAKIEKSIENDEELQKLRRKLEIEVKERNVVVTGDLADYSQASSLVAEIRRIRGVNTLDYSKLNY